LISFGTAAFSAKSLISDLLIFVLSFCLTRALPAHLDMLLAVRTLAPRASQSMVRLSSPVSTTMFRMNAGYHTAVTTNMLPLNPVAMYQHLNTWKLSNTGSNNSALQDINKVNAFNMREVDASLNVEDCLPVSMAQVPLVISDPISLVTDVVEWEALNRNARRPKRANHGKRPCSHVRRRSKRLK
jgi:hypothetical protein